MYKGIVKGTGKRLRAAFRYGMNISKIKTILSQDFFRHNFVFLVGSLGIAVFSYLYYPVIGRMVSVSEYGEIQAWISLFMEFGIVLTAFGYVITNIANNHENAATKQILLLEIERLALLVSVVLFVGLGTASHYLSLSFQFSSMWPFVALGILIILNVPATFRTYYLQGNKQLKEVALAGIIFAAGKLAVSVILIAAGLNISGVIFGYIIAQIINLMYVATKTRGKLPTLRSSVPVTLKEARFVSERHVLKQEMLYGLFILVLLAVVTVLYTSDAIVVRRYFTPNEAGLFSGISSVARIVFFVTASIAGVLIASVKIKNSTEENTRTLTKSLFLLLAIGGCVLLVFSVLPDLCVKILIGSKYATLSYLLPWVAVSTLIASLNNLLFSYQIALRRYESVAPALLGSGLLVVLLFTRHRSMPEVIADYILCNLLIFMITMVQIYVKRSKHD